MPIKPRPLRTILTSTGDMLYLDTSGQLARLPIGSAGATLSVIGTIPGWSAGGGGGGGPGPNGSVVLDTFTRADSATLGANWTADVGAASFAMPKISTNRAMAATANAFSSAWWNAASFGPNCECFTTISSPGTFSYIGCRMTNVGLAGLTGYWLNWDNAGHMFLVRQDAVDNLVQIGTTISATVAAGDKLGISAVGSSITAWRQPSGGAWTNVGSVIDTTYSLAGYLAIRFQNDATAALTNFGGGTI